MTNPLSTPARNALLQLYRLGFLWYDVGNTEESGVADELINDSCAMIVHAAKEEIVRDKETSIIIGVAATGHQRIEITMRGIEMAALVHADQQRAVNQINRQRKRSNLE